MISICKSNINTTELIGVELSCDEQNFTLNGKPVHHRAQRPHKHKHNKGNFAQPLHLLANTRKVGRT